MKKLISETGLNPVIRGANYFSAENVNFGPRYNYAYQLFYMVEGNGTASIEKKTYLLEPGMLFFYGPGHSHSFSSSPGTRITFSTVCFSCREMPPEKLETINKSVLSISDDYWSLADPEENISGFPELPFMIKLDTDLRKPLEMHLREINREMKNELKTASQLYMKSHLLDILLIIQSACGHASGESRHPIVAAFEEYISKHYQTNLTRDKVSRAIGTSESYLTALLKQYSRTNFTDYLTRIRLEKAMELIEYSNLKIKEICAATGFNSVSYFVRKFGEHYGKSPNRFRK